MALVVKTNIDAAVKEISKARGFQVNNVSTISCRQRMQR